jgi:hypothetical protein
VHCIDEEYDRPASKQSMESYLSYPESDVCQNSICEVDDEVEEGKYHLCAYG